MLRSSSGCPSGWSPGSIYQDNEDNGNANSYSPSYITSYLTFGTGPNFRTYYCTKTFSNGVGSWPKGRYCIARFGGNCPSGFHSGFRYWDDEDNNNGNARQGTYPDGIYGRDTRTYYCCRNDGNVHSEIALPSTMPFVLYRYQSTCQRVRGMYHTDLSIHFDDEDSGNANSCSGVKYPEGSCGRNHNLNLCYYAARR